MNLRLKTFIIVTAIFALAFVIMAVSLRYFILRNYIQEENQLTTEKVLQVNSALEESLNSMENVASDWAEWDDTYHYMQDRNPAYLKSNFVSSFFFNYRFNLAALLDIDGNPVFSAYYETIPGDSPGTFDLKLVDMPDAIKNYLKPGSPLLVNPHSETGIKGNILLPGNPMIFVSHPILTSDGAGPYRGTLIFGRYLDSLELKTVADVTHLSVNDYELDDSRAPEDVKRALVSLTQGNPIVVQTLDDTTIAGYTWLKDIGGKPDLILKIDSPRVFFMQASKDLTFYMFAFMAFGLVFILVALLILEKMVISRISFLSSNVKSIGHQGNLSSRISLSGKDEVTGLAKNINGMLENIEQSRKLQKESETFNYVLLQDSPNPIEVMNPDGSLRFVNSALEKITGYSRVQLIGRRPPFPWWTNDNTQQYFTELRKIMFDGDHKMEKQFHKPDGENFWVDITATAFQKDGDVKFFISNWVDVTERIKSDEAMRQSEQRFRELAELLPELVFETDLAGHLTFVNRVAFNVFGYTPAGLADLKLVDFIAPEYQETASRDLQRMINGEDLGNVEYVAKRRDQKQFPCFIHTTPVKNYLNKIIGLRGILVDITIQKTTSEELKALYEREKKLREALQMEITSRTDFTRALVHELKTPLTPIMVSSELLVEELKQEPFLGLSKIILRGAENMNRRVNELLDMARGEIGMLKVKLNPLEPRIIIQEVIKNMEPVASKSGQLLKSVLPDQLPLVMADEDRVRQVLFNLISNAIKYSSTGGQTTVYTQTEPGELIVAIQDTGQGIGEEEIPRLFQPYYRIEGHEHLSGLGLGLALAKSLVELQNGRIWVTSKKGAGSTFFFTLPVTH